jgi:hypothetical protein
VSAAIPLAVYALWLAAGFAFVLWGLRIFKAYVAMLGVVAGGVLGATAGALTGGETQAILIGGGVGAAIGMLLAWPLQKFLVFLASGFAGALFGAVIVLALEQSDKVVPASIAGFLIAGILVLALYDTLVICAMAFQGAQAVFHAVFVPADAYSGSLQDIASRLLGIYADRVLALAITTALFMSYALWYQKSVARHRDPADPRWAASLAARRVSVRYAALILLSWTVTAALSISGQWDLSSFDLAGVHALSWPLVSIATLAFLRTRQGALVAQPAALNAPVRRRHRRLLTITVFGAIVPPVVTGALFAIYGAPWETMSGFYQSFLHGPASALAAKFSYSFALLPMLLATAVPELKQGPAVVQEEPPPEQPAATEAV